MKIEMNDGQMYAIPETIAEVQGLLKLSKVKDVETLAELPQVVTRRKYRKMADCPECGKAFKRAGMSMHMLRAHKGENWTSNPGERKITVRTIA